MQTKIEDLKTGDSFSTVSGKRNYTIVDVVFSKELNRNVWLLKGGWYVTNPNKEVVKL